MLVEDANITFRVVTIGNSSVGKTSMINRFIKNEFNENELNTVGANMSTFRQERDGHNVIFQFWDTAGQEQYCSLGPVYFRNAAAAILVFDVSNMKTFENLGHWLEEFKSVTGDNSIVVVVGNKIDIEIGREVSTEIAQKWADDHGYSYFETSASSGYGIKDLFKSLTDMLYNKNVQSNQEQIESILKTPEQEEQKSKNCSC